MRNMFLLTLCRILALTAIASLFVAVARADQLSDAKAAVAVAVAVNAAKAKCCAPKPVAVVETVEPPAAPAKSPCLCTPEGLCICNGVCTCDIAAKPTWNVGTDEAGLMLGGKQVGNWRFDTGTFWAFTGTEWGNINHWTRAMPPIPPPVKVTSVVLPNYFRAVGGCANGQCGR